LNPEKHFLMNIDLHSVRPRAPFVPAQRLDEWLERVQQRTARIGVIGLGYVGLPLTLLLSEDGFCVTGFDIDAHKVDVLNAGGSYIHRIEPVQIVAAHKAGFRATTDFAEAADLDAVLICVPTPLHPDHTPDISAVLGTMEMLAPHLRVGQLVVLESTTYPGTTEEIVATTIERHGIPVQRGQGDAAHDAPLVGVMVAFSPEREDPGNLTTPRRDIPKVLGGLGTVATVATQGLYGVPFAGTVAMSNPAAAEMTKLLENIYRSVNIALINELKQLCLRMDIDIWEVIAAATTKPFGFQAFYPGPGVGGHCIPVDPFYLTWKARQFGFETRFIELAGAVNEAMPGYVIDAVRTALSARGIALSSAQVLVLGVAYKRDVDDLRESPALTVIELLRSAGAEVAYNDPFFPHVGSGRHYRLDMDSTPLAEVGRFDCVVLVTDHSQYDLHQIVADCRLLVDTRNATRGIVSSKIVRC
jgi:UDP-N-acetyl-D-glucosamine dehydrogenase